MSFLAATAGAAFAVAAVCAVVAVACWRALLKSGNPRILLVAAAFALLAAKNAVKGMLLSGEGEPRLAEFLFSLTDLAAVGLIAWPLLSRGGRP